MYPSSHKAFSNEEDRGQRYNLLLSAAAQSKMKEVMATYHGVIHMLREVINFVKNKNQKSFPFNWIQKLVAFISGASFQNLDPELSNVGKIIGYILENCGNPSAALLHPVEGKVIESVATAPSSEVSPSSPFDLRSSLSAIKRSAGKNDSDGSSKKGLKLSGLSRGIKTPLGGRNSGSVEKAVEAELPGQPPASTPAVADTPDEKPKSSSSSWETFDFDILKHIDGMARPTEEKEKDPSNPLPAAFQEVKFRIPEPGIAKQAVQKLGSD
ncbi:hypothetical protein V491_07463, partial [Pseudogymnoascus sp. VKM F-3775]